jgi:hypothetical protein
VVLLGDHKNQSIELYLDSRVRQVFNIEDLFSVGEHESFGIEVTFQSIGAAALNTWDRGYQQSTAVPPIVACRDK